MSRACEFHDEPAGEHDQPRRVRVYIRVAAEDGDWWSWREVEIVSTGNLNDIADGLVPPASKPIDRGVVNLRYDRENPMLPENGSY